MASTRLDDLLSEYDRAYPTHLALAATLKGLIGDLIAMSNVRVHSITERVKERDSLERKIRSRIESYEVLCDVTDVVALRIITYFPDQVDAVAEIVKREFDVDPDRSIDKRATLSPDQFGYLSLHYIAKLPRNRLDLTENQRFEGCVFEVQIRSILQHAWAEIEHDLGYKSEAAVPRHIRRRFSQLAGLLEVADDLFVSLRNDVEAYREELKRHDRADLSDVHIDLESIAEYVATSPLVLAIDERIAAGAESSLLGREYVANVAEFLSRNLQAAAFETVGEVDQWLERFADVVTAFGTRRRAGEAGAELLPGVSLLCLFYVRIALSRDAATIQEAIEASAISGSADELAVRVLERFEAVAAEIPLPPPPT